MPVHLHSSSRPRTSGTRPTKLMASAKKSPLSLLSSVAIGTAFGFLLEKAKVSLPDVVRAQMQMRSMTMMKMFLTACSLSMFALSMLVHFADIKRDVEPKRCNGNTTYMMLH